MPKERVVVTGGAGFIGSNIVRELLGKNYRVTVIDNLSTGKLSNLADIRRRVDFFQADIRNYRLMKRLFAGADFVLHQAALPSVPRSIGNPVESHDVNVNGTFSVLMAARERKIKKVVMASSSSIYGDRKNYGLRKIKFKKEVMKPMPLSPYAVNKLIGEEYAKVFSHIYHLPTVCLRYFNVFGHNQDPKSQYAAVIPRFITMMIKKSRPVIYGDGTQTRDFTYIDNVVQANLLAMVTLRAVKGETINVACGESISLLRLVARINHVLRKHIKPIFSDPRPGEVKKSLANIEKARSLLGYTPLVLFDDGLRRTIEWYQEHLGNDR